MTRDELQEIKRFLTLIDIIRSQSSDEIYETPNIRYHQSCGVLLFIEDHVYMYVIETHVTVHVGLILITLQLNEMHKKN
jgi:hypothetical protein